MKIEQFFDLRIGILTGEDTLDTVLAAERSAEVDVLKVLDPSADRTAELCDRGYYVRTQWVEYAREIQSSSLSSGDHDFLVRASSARRRESKRAAAACQSLQRNGEIELVVDRGRRLDYMSSFVDMHTRVMAGKPRGNLALKARLAQLGSLEALAAQFPLSVYILVRGEMQAGLVAYDLEDRYSIGFCACAPELRARIGGIQLLLILKLVELSLTEGRARIGYGTDTNLYGHHLSMGLLAYKLSLGFRAMPRGSVELTKFVRWTSLPPPIAFFQTRAHQEPQLMLITRGITEEIRRIESANISVHIVSPWQ